MKFKVDKNNDLVSSVNLRSGSGVISPWLLRTIMTKVFCEEVTEHIEAQFTLNYDGGEALPTAHPAWFNRQITSVRTVGVRLTFHNEEEVHMKGILWKLVKSTRTIIKLEAEQYGRILVNSLHLHHSFLVLFLFCSYWLVLFCLLLLLMGWGKAFPLCSEVNKEQAEWWAGMKRVTEYRTNVLSAWLDQCCSAVHSPPRWCLPSRAANSSLLRARCFFGGQSLGFSGNFLLKLGDV